MKKLLLILLCFPILMFGQQSFNFLHDGLNRDYIYYSPNNNEFIYPNELVNKFKKYLDLESLHA